MITTLSTNQLRIYKKYFKKLLEQRKFMDYTKSAS